MNCPRFPKCVLNYVRPCVCCQRYKNTGRGIGHVAPTMSTLGIPLEEITINCIGPWKVELPPPHNILVLNTFTIINTTTGVIEIIRATQQNPTGQETVDALDNTRLTQYPKPACCIFDQGRT